MAPLQPVDPEVQKIKLLSKFQKKFNEAQEKFTLKIQKRYKCLIKTVSGSLEYTTNLNC